MPAMPAPVIDQLPVPSAAAPDLPPLPAPSVDAIAVAHSDMMDGDLSAEAIARGRLAPNGSGASIDGRLQYGTPGNGAMLSGGADTRTSTVHGGAELALTNDELRAKLAGNLVSGPDGTQLGINGMLEGGDEQSGARLEGGMTGIGQDPNLHGAADLRIGDPDAFHFRLAGQGSDLTTTPQGTVAATMGGRIGPHVNVASTAQLTTNGQQMQAGGGGTIGIQTPAGTINAYGQGQTNGSTSSGEAGVLFQGQF